MKDRRKFFETGGKGLLGLGIASIMPTALFANFKLPSSSKRNSGKKMEIKVHPLAVSRINGRAK